VEAIDTRFICERLGAAVAFRERVVRGSNAYRLVHAEGDLLPGLIIDRYGDRLVVQLLTQGMDRVSGQITEALTGLLHPAGIVARNDVASREKENLPQEVTVLCGDATGLIGIEMNGLRQSVDLLHGQKTGVFLDQRENYLAARNYSQGKVLDCFTGTGGFAIHLAGACDSVEAVDGSQPSLTTAAANAQTNGITNVSWTQADVLDYLPSLRSAHRRFDLVVVDPPAFAKSRSAVEGAARGYKEINLRALQLLGRGGVLISCSCSHHMSEANLLEIIASAALDCGKTLCVRERRTQSQDHPILLTVPETHYLKCLILEVL
jgi:23S rRNA (cytosine1962-C5)-methyltransferase